MGKQKLILIHGAGIVTVDSEERVYLNGCLAIEGDQILAVGQSTSILAEYSSRADEVVSLEGHWILPGGQHVPGMAKAVEKLGIRACLARSTMDAGEGLPALWGEETTDTCMKIQEDLIIQLNGSADDRIRIWFGLRQILNSTDNLLLRTKEAASRCNTGIHMVEMMGQAGVKVSHCPAAAMRMLGFAPVTEMLSAGICVSLGTDGAPSNNRMSLVDEMYLASQINKGKFVFDRGTTDPTALSAETILKMATINGARTVLQGDMIGSLEVGKKADLIVVNPDKWTMLPLHDPISNVVYCMRTENISSVMCNGQWIMRDQKILTVDEAAVIAKAKDAARNLIIRAGIQLPMRGNVIH